MNKIQLFLANLSDGAKTNAYTSGAGKCN